MMYFKKNSTWDLLFRRASSTFSLPPSSLHLRPVSAPETRLLGEVPEILVRAPGGSVGSALGVRWERSGPWNRGGLVGS